VIEPRGYQTCIDGVCGDSAKAPTLEPPGLTLGRRWPSALPLAATAPSELGQGAGAESISRRGIGRTIG
jgi:hypothetical protein